jgi:electron-transferring-flavoprotein dehydrogenase
VHGAGWPLSEHGATGGSFLYHLADNQVAVGLIADLNYANPYLSPFEEFQRFKSQAQIKKYLEGGKRLCYGARAITKGGLNSLPKQSFPGGLLIGCDAGTLNFAKIKGIHTAMKSAMLAAETVHTALQAGAEGRSDLVAYEQNFKASWLYAELHQARNFGPALHKFGTFAGGAFNWIEQNLFGGRMFFTLKDETSDHEQLQPAASISRSSTRGQTASELRSPVVGIHLQYGARGGATGPSAIARQQQGDFCQLQGIRFARAALLPGGGL